MNQSDKYYLRQGRLELSMLEDEASSLEAAILAKEKKTPFTEIECTHTDSFKEVPQQPLKMNQEIYHTLHAMGQFLTKTEVTILTSPATTAHHTATANSSVEQGKAKAMQVSLSRSKASHLEREKISKEDQITDLSEVISLRMEQSSKEESRVIEDLGDTKRIDLAKLKRMAEEQLAAAQEAVEISTQISKEVPIKGKQALSIEACLEVKPISYMKNHMVLQQDKEKELILTQANIDNLLSLFFKPHEVKYEINNALKEHIEKCISGIRNN